MDIYEAINTRRSVRSFRPDPVPQEALDRILEAGRCAPSSLNLQPWKFIIIRDAATKRAMVKCCPGQGFVEEAPIVIIGCALPTRGIVAGCESSAPADVSVAFAYMSLAAAAEGLGTCWITQFDHEAAHQALEMPEDVRAVLISPLGYPTDATLRTKHRKPMSEVVCEGKFA